MRRVLGVAVVLLALLAGAAFAQQTAKPKAFPKLRYGIGVEPTAGGGYFAGIPYRTRAAAVAWSRRRRTLTLYLLRERTFTCRSLLKVAEQRGHLIQAVIEQRPLQSIVGRAVPDQTLEFITYLKGAKLHDAGLKQGVRLVLTRVDSYPGGVWHGSLDVPTKVYADKHTYGYHGTFAAKWCDLKRQ